VTYPRKHLLAIEGLEPPHIADLLDLAESYALLNRSGKTQRDLLKGRTLINLFFEDSTRTRTSLSSPASGWAPMSSICRSAHPA
jgi:aspartate carbamoyltransferase catalytic subunit